MPQGISVVICCYNSYARITPTLEHLINQTGIPASLWEIIVVDNRSTDGTAEKAIKIWDSFNLEKPAFKVVLELTPGLSAARQKGIDESNFEYVLFCDDDNWLDAHYLSTALNIMQSNTAIGALGGSGNPVFAENAPPYFWENQYHALAVGDQSAIEGDITDERGVLYGAGMVLNKSAYKILKEKYQFEFLLTDRIGDNLVSSGDHELCLALRKAGFRIFSSHQLKFQHFIPGYRTTIKYYKKLFLAFGVSYAMLHGYRIKKHNSNNITEDYRYIALRCVKNILFTELELFFGGYYFTDNKYKYLDQIHALYSNIGQLKTLIKVRNLYKKQFSTHLIFKADI